MQLKKKGSIGLQHYKRGFKWIAVQNPKEILSSNKSGSSETENKGYNMHDV